MATQANLYKSQHSAHLVDRIGTKMCNNLLVVQNYLHEKIIAHDHEILLVKHTEKSSKEVKVNIDISVMKMHMFLTYFYNTKKNEYMEENIKTKKAAINFNTEQFTIDDIDIFQDCMKENGITGTKKYMKNVNKKILFGKYFNFDSLRTKTILNEPEQFDYRTLNKILFTNKNIVVDVKEYLDNDKCFFAIYERSNGKTSRISKYFYHENGYCYHNNFINDAIDNSLNLVKVMNGHPTLQKLEKKSLG